MIVICTCLNVSWGNDPFCDSFTLSLVGGQRSKETTWQKDQEKLCLCLRATSLYLKAPMLPTIITAPIIPIRLYFGTVLESCLRITMCMSSWKDEETEEWAGQWARRWGEKALNGKDWRLFWGNVHLDVRSLLLLTKGQPAQKVEQSADLLGCEVVHVVQDSLYHIVCFVKNTNGVTTTVYCISVKQTLGISYKLFDLISTLSFFQCGLISSWIASLPWQKQHTKTFLKAFP